jgi:hypothetical protein
MNEQISIAEHKAAEQHLVTSFTAILNEKPVGHLSVYENPFLKHNQEPVLLIGDIECTDNKHAFDLLIGKAEEVAVSKNIPYVITAMNGSTWNDYRLPVTAASVPFITDLSQPTYYYEFLLQNGYTCLHKYFSAISDITTEIKPSDKEAEYLHSQHVKLRSLDIEHFEAELQKIYKLSSAAFVDNPFSSPIDEAGFINKYLPLKPFIDPELVLLAEQNEELVAFVFPLPNIVSKTGKQIVLKTMAKNPSCAIKGLIDIMIKELHRQAFSSGYREIIHAFIYEDNKSLQISKRYNGRIIREYALLIKKIK